MLGVVHPYISLINIQIFSKNNIFKYQWFGIEKSLNSVTLKNNIIIKHCDVLIS